MVLNTLGGRGRLGYKTKGRCPRRRTRLLKPWLGEPIAETRQKPIYPLLGLAWASSLASANVRNVKADKSEDRDGMDICSHTILTIPASDNFARRDSDKLPVPSSKGSTAHHHCLTPTCWYVLVDFN